MVLLGFDPPCLDTIRKYRVKPEGGTEKSQNWLTFLRNHTRVSWGMDFFTVPTIRFQILYVFVVLHHARRQVVHMAVTPHPTMAWVIQQLREAMPFGIQPTYLFRDDDEIYGDEVSRFLRGTGIEEVRTAFRSPWQSPLSLRQSRIRAGLFPLDAPLILFPKGKNTLSVYAIPATLLRSAVIVFRSSHISPQFGSLLPCLLANRTDLMIA